MSAPILLLSKKDHWSQQAGNLARCFFGDQLIWEQGTVGDPLPASAKLPQYHAVISFLSPWIIPQELLDKAQIALNFHPGSCDYPGIGCYNFALYEQAAHFGPVCHQMLAKVDSGNVVDERLFMLLDHETVESLKLRTMVVMLDMFHDILGMLKRGVPLPTNARQWQRKAFTRSQLDDLCIITPNMSEEERQKRILATTYPGYPGPYLLHENGEKDYYPVPDRKAIA